jgi:hypothetical protein
MYQSAKVLRQEQKIWAKKDEMLISETQPGEAPSDPFKTIHIVKRR